MKSIVFHLVAFRFFLLSLQLFLFCFCFSSTSLSFLSSLPEMILLRSANTIGLSVALLISVVRRPYQWWRHHESSIENWMYLFFPYSDKLKGIVNDSVNLRYASKRVAILHTTTIPRKRQRNDQKRKFPRMGICSQFFFFLLVRVGNLRRILFVVEQRTKTRSHRDLTRMRSRERERERENILIRNSTSSHTRSSCLCFSNGYFYVMFTHLLFFLHFILFYIIFFLPCEMKHLIESSSRSLQRFQRHRSSHVRSASSVLRSKKRLCNDVIVRHYDVINGKRNKRVPAPRDVMNWVPLMSARPSCIHPNESWWRDGDVILKGNFFTFAFRDSGVMLFCLRTSAAGSNLPVRAFHISPSPNKP